MRLRELQVEIWKAGLDAFGFESISNPQERALRVFEEATELLQATGVPFEKATQVANHVYSKPPGDVRIEMRQVGVTLAAFAQCVCCDLEEEVRYEYDCFIGNGPNYYAARLARKTALGLTISS